MFYTVRRSLLPLLLSAALLYADDDAPTAKPTFTISAPTTDETHRTIREGMDWLLSQQQSDGHWSNPGFPALTALPLWALVQGGCTDTQAIEKATQSILSNVHDDGSIWRKAPEGRRGGGLPNYNTAICMVALHSLNQPELAPVILKARDYMAKSQYLVTGESGYGGFGYQPGSDRPHIDLSNSHLAFEAMKLTEEIEDLRPDGEARTDLDWQAALTFIQNCQNNPAVNTNTWVNTAPEEIGGFVYKPDQSRAGTTLSETSALRLRSMPGMTYAGLLSYIYADVDPNDPRVKATIHWIRNNWNLDIASRDPEKAGTPEAQDGLYYLYNVMSKGMNACGVDILSPEQGTSFNWRTCLIGKLLDLRKTDPAGGIYWVNDSGRFFESDPVLVTAYSLLALEYALPKQ
ncbi:MAG: cycloartenol synthase [Kiritimatiellae bacterium]|nr:cycloartenol synthase [Kiritimatiellia bacterium]